MMEAIARLRKFADDTESHARQTNQGRLVEAVLTDLAVKGRWLAGEAAKLCAKSRAVSGADATCTKCSEKCPGTQSSFTGGSLRSFKMPIGVVTTTSQASDAAD
jgi:hypothetical protein